MRYSDDISRCRGVDRPLCGVCGRQAFVAPRGSAWGWIAVPESFKAGTSPCPEYLAVREDDEDEEEAAA
jgi:hypothetical protein